MQQNLDWHRLANADEVATAVYKHILVAADKAIADHGTFKLVLAGGTTPEKIYRMLAKAEADWARWQIFYGDERCLPVDHADRNSLLAERAFLNAVPIPSTQIFTLPAELGPEAGALQYRPTVEAALPFDLVLLGLGEDGHTASLFPGHVHIPEELTHAVYNSPKPPPERISLSAKALGSGQVIFIVTGANKRDAAKAWRAGEDLPVGHIASERGVEVYIDSDADMA